MSPIVADHVVLGNASIIQVLLDLAAFLILIVVAMRQARRSDPPSRRAGNASLQRWWISIAVYFGLQTLFHASFFITGWTVTTLMIYNITRLGVLAASLAFLTQFMMFKVGAVHNLRRWVLVYYFLPFAVVAVLHPLGGPFMVEQVASGLDLRFAETGDVPLAASAIPLVFYIIPVAIAMVQKMRDMMQTQEREARYRGAMLMTSALMFIFSITLEDVLPADFHFAFLDSQIEILGGGLLVAGLIPIIAAWSGYRAYQPAAWVRLRYNMPVQ